MTKYNICAECNKQFSGRKKKYCSQDCHDEVRRRKNRERMRKVKPPKPDVTIECEWCGKEHTVPARTVHQARFCSEDCRYTWRSRVVYEHKPIEEHNAERRKQKIARQKRLERERVIKAFNRSIQTVIKFKEEEQRVIDLTRDCAECGSVFYNPSPNVLTCTTECSRKRNRRISRTIYKNRINKENLVDKNISLTKLYKRDEGICYLCDEQCEWGDKVLTAEGHTIVGGNYPSIEHVKPLSKGGMHSWNNIKLACMRCNTLKRDRIL